jgi:hypothetical protein
MLRPVVDGVNRVQEGPPEIERPESRAPPDPPRSRRVIAGAVALLVASAGVALAARAFGGLTRSRAGQSLSIVLKPNGLIYFQIGGGRAEPGPMRPNLTGRAA